MRIAAAVLIFVAAVQGVRHKFSDYRSPPTDGKLFALLVAGSDGWYNYRHQADVAHSYHVLRNHGVPEENIIVMMKDDIADNDQNPYKGKLYNRPHGDDVYEGLKIDYKKGDVNPENFLNILKGNASGVTGGNGRIIESGPKDRIFVYFTDHGATGLIAFPRAILTVKDLNEALEYMYEKDRYSQLVFYLEACESGSMFEKVLKKDINVYAITAANSKESSWGTYCENDMGLPCLGDLFSVNWMDDSDKEDIDVETLDYQYQLVKKLTDKSHVMHYGNLSMATEPVGWFQGAKQKSRRANIHYVDDYRYKQSSIPSRDIELAMLEKDKEAANDLFEQKFYSRRIRTIHRTRKAIKQKYHEIVDYLIEEHADRRRMFTERNEIEDVDCHHDIVNAFHILCFNYGMYSDAMKYAYVLNNLCEEIGDVDEIINAMIDKCLA